MDDGPRAAVDGDSGSGLVTYTLEHSDVSLLSAADDKALAARHDFRKANGPVDDVTEIATRCRGQLSSGGYAMSRQSEAAAAAHNQAALDGRTSGEAAKSEPLLTTAEVLGNLVGAGVAGTLLRPDPSHYNPPLDPALKETYDQEYDKAKNG